MMKSSIKRKDDNFTTMIENNSCPIKKLDNSEVESNKHNHLMDRLADGKKVLVDKKEMKRLTNKNYMNLPEIKKKREEELKRAEI
jgi:ALMS motif